MANSLPSAADTILIADPLATLFKAYYAVCGINAPGESGTLCADANALQLSAVGNGTSGNPGITNAYWKGLIDSPLIMMPGQFRYSFISNITNNALLRTFNTVVKNGLPSGWNVGTSSVVQAFDAWLTYLNGAYGASAAANGGNALATPGSAGTLTAVYNSAGALPNCSSGNAPIVTHTLIGATKNLSSLAPSAASAVAITGGNNALSYAISGTVPTGVNFVRLFRTQINNQSGPKLYSQDVPVSPGSSYPTIILTVPDSALGTFSPPSWMQCAMTPEFAAMWAIVNSSNLSSSGPGSLPVLGLGAMLSPGNVAMNPGTNYQGLGNSSSGAEFGSTTITGSGSATYTAGSIQTVNGTNTAVQGFCGACAYLQARVTTAFAGGVTTPTITYTYYDAAHGWGTVETASGLAASTAFATGNIGDIVAFHVPSGRIVQSVAACTVSSGATSGVFVIEAQPVRVY